jgi:hypothetical protein
MKNYCPDLFNTVFVQKNSEDKVLLGHCCVSKFGGLRDTVDINDSFLADNRQYYLDTGELPEACEYCTKIETEGFYSRRQMHARRNVEQNSFPVQVQLEKLEYNCDNICNLKCVMCSSYYSSSWIDDEIKLGFPVLQKIKHTKHNNLLYNVDVSKVTAVYFNGGEPLMTRDHINVLNYLIEKGNPDKIWLTYSSNGTFPITDELAGIWEKFGGIEILFSIDAVGDAYDYIRYPGNWTQVEQNLLGFKDLRSKLKNCDLHFLITVGIHNVFYLDQTLQWASNNEFKVITQDTNGRSQLSLANFPAAYINQLHNYARTLPNETVQQNIISQSSLSKNDTRWVEYLNSLDRIRGNSWKTSLAKLYNLDPVYFDSITGDYCGH